MWLTSVHSTVRSKKLCQSLDIPFTRHRYPLLECQHWAACFTQRRQDSSREQVRLDRQEGDHRRTRAWACKRVGNKIHGDVSKTPHGRRGSLLHAREVCLILRISFATQIFASRQRYQGAIIRLTSGLGKRGRRSQQWHFYKIDTTLTTNRTRLLLMNFHVVAWMSHQ